MANETEARGISISPEGVAESERNHDILERIVKYVYLANHYKSNTLGEVAGGFVVKCVTYRGKTYAIVTSISDKDVSNFKNDEFLKFCFPNEDLVNA